MTENLFNLLIALMAGLISAALSWFIARRKLPSSYRVAIIGYPRAGKTTLITAIFEHLFRRGPRGVSIVPRGDETLRRINGNIERLELGLPILSTEDQDVFAYRADVAVKSWLGHSRYKLEIGDFPGEDSVDFVEKEASWLHVTPYFKWAMAADAFLFVVDAERLVVRDSDLYVARQKSAFRAAWQRIQEYHMEGASDLKSKPVVLVFSKVDLFASREELDALTKKVTELLSFRFSDLIQFFERESGRFSVVLTSVNLWRDGERLGIPFLVAKLFPRAFPGTQRPRADYERLGESGSL